jgi:predicted TPR repeat methyltransferase
MLDIAAGRGAYAQLEQGELTAVLARIPTGSAQAVLAADVFIYVGNLEAVFAEVARVLAPDGLFAMSVEGLEDGSYQLQPTGRYAQSPGYLRMLAARCGLQERKIERAHIRREGSGAVEGWIALFARTDRGAAATAA